MKIRVIEAFRDRFHHSHVFSVGEVVDFTEERAQELIARKLAVKYSDGKDAPVGKEGDEPPKAEVEVPASDETKEDDAKVASEQAAALKIAKARKKMKK